MPYIKGKYGEYKVTAEQKRKWDEENNKSTHQKTIKAVRKEFPNLKLNGVSPFKKTKGEAIKKTLEKHGEKSKYNSISKGHHVEGMKKNSTGRWDKE